MDTSIRSWRQSRTELQLERSPAAHAGIQLLLRRRRTSARKWDNIAVKAIFDNWQFSGITLITRWHVYANLTYSYANVPTGALIGQPARSTAARAARSLCDPNLSGGERTFERQFNSDCIEPPTDRIPLGTVDQRRIPGAGVHELGHLGVQEHPDRGARVYSFVSSSTTRSTPTSGPV